MKSIFNSKTFWLAFIQAVGGAFVIFFTEMPDLVGYVPIVKSVVDIALRFVTKDAVTV